MHILYAPIRTSFHIARRKILPTSVQHRSPNLASSFVHSVNCYTPPRSLAHSRQVVRKSVKESRKEKTRSASTLSASQDSNVFARLNGQNSHACSDPAAAEMAAPSSPSNPSYLAGGCLAGRRVLGGRRRECNSGHWTRQGIQRFCISCRCKA